MDVLLILTYAAFAITIFRVFRIPLNKWTVPTAVLGGIVIIGALIATMNYNHPYSEISRSYYATTPIVPQVRGHVIDVPVLPNKPVKKGDVLFRIDPTPFEAKVSELNARVKQAELDYTREKELVRRKVEAKRNLEIAEANLNALKAQHREAEFELEHTVVHAPADGLVTQLTLRPGMMAAPLPLRPVMVFVHKEAPMYIAWFRQNSLLRLNEGDSAEMIFDAIPGAIFAGRVEHVLPALAQGQLQPSGDVLSENTTAIPDRVPVIIRITDERFEQYAGKLPGGAYAQAAIYSEHFEHLSVMRKVLLRMAGWMNYLFPFH
ncbi:Inner membrane protein YiaV [BD1-7 clade bacterium]|uniref:Inner membrane protein YiaV n=1 Tax=BD1-7 clade bacterium TaxID=2029982 RepID=A0A5S9QB72_9GAMM|nr:Inner membrane protein YiaV [BD1-7 clade bacterium]